MSANGKAAPAIPSMGHLATRSAKEHAERLRYWARQAAVSTKMQRELVAAAQFIEGERKEQHGVLQ